MFTTLKVRIKGVTPILLHNGMMADPLNPATQELKKVSGKRNKTDADHEAVSRLEWYASLYVEDGKIVMPGINIERALVMASRKTRKGKQAESSLMVDGDIPIEFPDADKSIDDIFSCGRYVDRRIVSVQRARVARTRPKFSDWSLSFLLKYDDEVLNESDIIEAIDTAGQLIGLGDFRPRFGKFERV